ncbi:tRNA pseudouridine synthase 10 [Natronorubrum sediminis]|uniref:tRNA pseudouridine synthase Pus10 n=1 Tax=Natronorubrum sediminis TaxID=640943 RepID=A0A1H6FRA1_9EURY|nr:tRNA pseudouridine(54/55) synthase Pus10 [Natronorubrum sediminis]SEH12688.1 tRNA pseudouridine synthase 10 [Natronorubrum sediminis]
MITEDARALLETGPVCDSCLGRPFAERSFGLTNDERGRALRTTIAMADDEDYDPTEPAECWVCEGYSGTYDALAETIVDALADVEFDTYQVGTRVPPLVEENDLLLREDADLEPDAGEAIKRDVNREVGRRVGAKTGTDVDFDRPDVLAVVDLEGFDPLEALESGSITSHAVDVQVNAAFVYGRYRKLERDIPQTEWPCRECGGSGTQLADSGEEPCDYCGGSGYMYDTSVEQVVRPHVVDALEGDEGTFHGAGREDVDARMLEEGRPFVLEVTRPQTRETDVDALEREINEAAEGAVEVEGLRLATYDMVERVKEHDASKHYRADVEFGDSVDEAAFESALEELTGTTVDQDTPQRVDHRRAALTRERTVYDMDGELLEPTRAEVRIHGEGGLYVKELVSSDEGRTVPSLAGVLETAAEVTALDVTGVQGEDEPFELEAFFRDEIDTSDESIDS